MKLLNKNKIKELSYKNIPVSIYQENKNIGFNLEINNHKYGCYTTMDNVEEIRLTESALFDRAKEFIDELL